MNPKIIPECSSAPPHPPAINAVPIPSLPTHPSGCVSPGAGKSASKIELTDTPTTEVRLIIDAQDDRFETLILASLFTDPNFFASVQSVLCVNPDGKRVLEDFRSDTHNALYLVLREHYRREVSPFLKLSEEVVEMQLKALDDKWRVGDVHLLCENEIPACVNRFREIARMAEDPALSIVKDGFLYWLRKRRFVSATEELMRSPSWDNDKLQKTIQKRVDAVSVASGDNHVKPFGSGLDSVATDVLRIPTGLRGLDIGLGGGLAPGEFTLVIASTGVGKTVFATQLAAHLAMLGQRGLLISTEERREALETRIVSNFANIPHARIKDKFDERLLQPAELKRYKMIRCLLETHLFIVEWLGDRSRSVGIDLETEVRQRAPLQFVILDWIGGAIGATTTDPSEVRLAYRAAADKLAEIATRHNVICIGLAQAHPTQARNKAKVESCMLAECKTLGLRATNIIGMSGLLDVADEGAETESIYRARQFFFISKARKGKGGLKPFLRQFDYMRISDAPGR